MKYQARLPEHNSNISHEHPLKEFALLLAGLAIIMAALYWVLGLAVDYVVPMISPEKEQHWFKTMRIDKGASHWISQDNTISPYDSPIFESLRSCANIEVPLTLWQVDSDQPNAVALPGGDILLFSGLFDHAPSENGLAFILAHELAHFKHRDHLRSIGRGIVLMTVTGFISGDSAALASLLTPAGLATQAQYSQTLESAADALALEILNCHYGHVGGATEFFENMLKEQDSSAIAGIEQLNHYFSSHPETQARIDNIEQLRQQLGFDKGP